MKESAVGDWYILADIKYTRPNKAVVARCTIAPELKESICPRFMVHEIALGVSDYIHEGMTVRVYKHEVFSSKEAAIAEMNRRLIAHYQASIDLYDREAAFHLKAHRRYKDNLSAAKAALAAVKERV